MRIQHVHPAHKGLTCEELVEVGRRLTEEQLTDFDLLQKVIGAELEALWRIRSAAELALPATQGIGQELMAMSRSLEGQLRSPARGSAKRAGGRAKWTERRLPGAGTLIVKEHAYQGYNAPEVKRPDGTTVRSRFVTFKFMVLDERGELLLLGDRKDVIHRSPSAAARAATGNSAEKGWAFFGIR